MRHATILRRRNAKAAFVNAVVALAQTYPKIATGTGAWVTDVSKAELMEALIAVRTAVNAEPEGRRGLETGKGCSSPPTDYKGGTGIHATTLYQFLNLGIENGNDISCMGNYFADAFRWALAVIRTNPHTFPGVNADNISAEIENAATVIDFTVHGELCLTCLGTMNAHMDDCTIVR